MPQYYKKKTLISHNTAFASRIINRIYQIDNVQTSAQESVPTKVPNKKFLLIYNFRVSITT